VLRRGRRLIWIAVPRSNLIDSLRDLLGVIKFLVDARKRSPTVELHTLSTSGL
jgi:hypothetical protein